MNLASLLRRISLKHIRHQKARTIIAIFGIALGVASMTSIDIVNPGVVRSLEDSINRITYHIHYGSIAWALLLAIGLSVLAGLYPAQRASKINITEALAYE